MGNRCQWGQVSFWGDGNVLESDIGDSYATLNAPELFTLKRLIFGYAHFTSITQYGSRSPLRLTPSPLPHLSPQSPRCCPRRQPFTTSTVKFTFPTNHPEPRGLPATPSPHSAHARRRRTVRGSPGTPCPPDPGCTPGDSVSSGVRWGPGTERPESSPFGAGAHPGQRTTLWNPRVSMRTSGTTGPLFPHLQSATPIFL